MDLENAVANGESQLSRLVLQGKRATIVIDANAGGIWINSNSPGAQPSLCLLGRETNANATEDDFVFCDLALGVDDDNGEFLQFNDSGKCRIVKIADLAQLLRGDHVLQSTPADSES